MAGLQPKGRSCQPQCQARPAHGDSSGQDRHELSADPAMSADSIASQAAHPSMPTAALNCTRIRRWRRTAAKTSSGREIRGTTKIRNTKVPNSESRAATDTPRATASKAPPSMSQVGSTALPGPTARP
jgi:hypothetical protein